MNSTGSLSIHMAVKFRQFSIQLETLFDLYLGSPPGVLNPEIRLHKPVAFLEYCG